MVQLLESVGTVWLALLGNLTNILAEANVHYVLLENITQLKGQIRI
jgi:hypothetical protein